MEIGSIFNPYKMFVGVHIPNALLRCKNLSICAAACYGRLAQYAGEDGKAFPSHKTLAFELGVSPRCVQNYIAELKQKGFIKVVPRIDKDTNTQTSNYYEFLWNDILEESLHVSCVSPIENLSTPSPPKFADKENQVRESFNTTGGKVTSPSKTKHFPDDSLPMKIALHLTTKIQGLSRTVRVPKGNTALQKWADTCDKIIRIDEREPNLIHDVIEFIYNDPFWSGVVLSPDGLRKNFDKISIKILQKKKTQHQGQHQSSAYKMFNESGDTNDRR